LENVDVGRLGVAHLTIDKSEIMQQKVISAIDAVAFSRSSAAPQTQVSAIKPRAAAAGAPVSTSR
jgi:hypothetical protein